MSLAQLCHLCGTDLARVRAAREPHYGLMLLRCPDCSAVRVRRPHPLAVAQRRFRHLDLAVTVLVINLATLAMLVTATVVAAVWLAVADWRPLGNMHADEVIRLVWSVALLPLAIGMWLTLGLPHWRRRDAWAAFFGIALVVLLIAGWLTFVMRWLAHGELRGGDGALEVLGTMGRAALALVFLAAVSVAGIAPGVSARPLLRSGLRSVRRWRRRRLRRERMR